MGTEGRRRRRSRLSCRVGAYWLREIDVIGAYDLPVKPVNGPRNNNMLHEIKTLRWPELWGRH